MKTSIDLEKIHILNHCDWNKIEENRGPPPKSRFLGGYDTVEDLIFGFVPRRKVDAGALFKEKTPLFFEKTQFYEKSKKGA